MASRLVAGGADVNAVCSPAGDTILHMLAHQASDLTYQSYVIWIHFEINVLNLSVKIWGYCILYTYWTLHTLSSPL